MSGTTKTEPCRILVVGANRQRVQTAISLIEVEPSALLLHDRVVHLEFIPCVAHFDSYQRDVDGGDGNTTMVRYLVQLKAFATDGVEQRSLLPLFDHAGDSPPNAMFSSLAGVAIGCGIEGELDTDLIRTFVWNMMQFQDKKIFIPVKTIEPSPEFATMAQELQVYRDLSPDEKVTATEQRTMGPGKMAAFVTDFALQIIQESIVNTTKESQERAPLHPNGLEAELEQEEEAVEESDLKGSTSSLARDKPMYLCRTCRSALFGNDSVREHEAAQHNFSHRKQHDAVSDTKCQSIFLNKSLPWMGDTGANEGKFACPTCRKKLGGWNWSGAQCSCGTWVVPAIQIPKGRVDVYQPFQSSSDLPPGTVWSNLLLRTDSTRV